MPLKYSSFDPLYLTQFKILRNTSCMKIYNQWRSCFCRSVFNLMHSDYADCKPYILQMVKSYCFSRLQRFSKLFCIVAIPHKWRNKVSEHFICLIPVPNQVSVSNSQFHHGAFSIDSAYLSDICKRSKSYSTHLEPGLSCYFYALSLLSWLLMIFGSFKYLAF